MSVNGDNNQKYNKMREMILSLMNEDYENFAKALISIERNIDDKLLLDLLYENYMDSSESTLLNKNIY